VAIDDQKYDPATFEARRQELKASLSDTRARVTEGYRNVIRWRERVDADGAVHVESNARLLRWPDGSVHLQVGEETFLVSTSKAEAAHPSYLYSETQRDLLEPLGVISKRTKLSLADLRSRTHRLLKAVVAGQAQQQQQPTAFSYELSDTRKVMAEASAAARQSEAASRRQRTSSYDLDEADGERSRAYEDMLEEEEAPRKAKKEKKEKKEKKHKKEKKEKKRKRSREESEAEAEGSASAGEMDDFIGESEEEEPMKRRRTIADEE
jgi:hypothetical protein